MTLSVLISTEWLRDWVRLLYGKWQSFTTTVAESAASFGLDFTADQQAYEITDRLFTGGPCVTGGRYQRTSVTKLAIFMNQAYQLR